MSIYELKGSDLAKDFENYKRWEREGRPPYFHTAFRPEERARQQFYHDTYHDSILPHPSGPFFVFRIQTDNCWTGNDTWVSGAFIVENGQIVIIHQSAGW